MFQVPNSVVVRRPITLNGVLVPAGTSLSKQQVIDLGRELNALLDSGFVVALPDPNERRGRPPRPTSLPPVIRNAMLGKMSSPLAVSATVAGNAVSVVVTGGVPQFTVTIDNALPQSKSSRTFAFTGVGAGDHQIEVTDGAGAKSDYSVKVTVADEVAKPVRKKAE
jgi:hypothetical protein